MGEMFWGCEHWKEMAQMWLCSYLCSTWIGGAAVVNFNYVAHKTSPIIHVIINISATFYFCFYFCSAGSSTYWHLWSVGFDYRLSHNSIPHFVKKHLQKTVKQWKKSPILQLGRAKRKATSRSELLLQSTFCYFLSRSENIVAQHIKKKIWTVRYRKWSPTANDPESANDPQNGPQMILDRKWSPKSIASDPERKIGMTWTLVGGSSCWFYYNYKTSD